MFKSMKRIIKWAGKYKGRLYLGSVFSFFSSLSTAIPTMAAAYALDKAIAAYWAGSTIESSLIWQTLWIIVGSIALNFLLSYLRAVLQESIGYEVAAGQRIHLGDVLKRVPLGYFFKNSVGDILTGVTTELSTLELQGMKMVDIIINGYAKFIAILLCFLFLSPAAAVISVVGVAFPHWPYMVSAGIVKRPLLSRTRPWRICLALRLNISAGCPSLNRSDRKGLLSKVSARQIRI